MKQRSIIIFLLLLIYGQSFLTNAQVSRLYDHRDYGFGDLSSNLITNIQQDRHGYIWVATEYGLNKFDGVRFTQFLHDVIDTTSILSNNVTYLCRSSDDNIWIGFNNGLQYYDESSDTFVTINFPGQIAPHITDIFAQSDGRILVATSGWGIFEIDKALKIAKALDEINSLVGGLFCREIYEDKNKNLWVAMDRIGLYRINPKNKEIKHFTNPAIPIPNGKTYNILQLPDERIVVATRRKAVAIDDSKNEVNEIAFVGKGNSDINEVKYFGDSIVVFSTEGEGLWSMNVSKTPSNAYPYSTSIDGDDLSHSVIRTFFQDRESNIWLGRFQKGLYLLPSAYGQFKYTKILINKENAQQSITALAKDDENRLWYAVDKLGVFSQNSKRSEIRSLESLNDIQQLVYDNANYIWFISAKKGLGNIHTTTGKISFLDKFSDQQINAMAISRDRSLYLSSFGNGLIKYDIDTDQTQIFSMNDVDNPKGHIGNDWINVVQIDKEGLVWLGHHKGISCYNPKTRSFLDIPVDKEFSNQIALSLLQDRSGDIWVGTYNGLFHFDRTAQAFRSYSTTNGLSSNVICGLAEDKYGTIWCSTFKGINALNIKDGRIITYYSGDGLVDRSYNRSVYLQDDHGNIYFAGNTGITSFTPENIQLKKFTKPIILTNIYIGDNAIKPNQSVDGKTIYRGTLPDATDLYFNWKNNNFTLELSTMDYNSPENISYEYRIKKINEKWTSTLLGVNLITYNNLSFGTHELEIRANKFGNYSEIKTIILHISPPWYFSTLAYLFYIAVVTGILILISKYFRERRLEKIHAYKLKLFTDISHEIRSPLTLVISPIDKLIKNATESHTKETLKSMRRNANRILNLVNQLLDVRKLESGQLRLKFLETNLVDLAKIILRAFETQAIERDIQLTFKSDAEKIPVWVDRGSFEKMLTNLLSNAFKFTPDGGKIQVDLFASDNAKNVKQNGNFIELRVSDSGPGIPENDLSKIFRRFYQSSNDHQATSSGTGIGLHLTKVMAELHGGKVYAENRRDSRGSMFSLLIPIGNEHIHTDDRIIVNDPVTLEEKPTGLPKSIDTEKLSIETPRTKEGHTSTYKVLVVDDEKDILNYVSQELRSFYKISTAENGAEALQIALTQHPDLIISDVAMPDMNGFQLVKKIKSNSSTNHIPVILLTAKTNHEDKLEGIGLGADAYLTKPFVIDELLAMSRNLIKNRLIVKGKYSGAQDQEGAVKTITFKSSDELLMERIVKTINNYLEDPKLNVQLVADEVGLSRVQLHRKVKALTGISTSEFIRNIRLKQAEKLLLEKRMNISQVAYALGFTNQTHFSTLFKKMYGLSPSEYIVRHTGNETDNES